jgi:hypothetical protein
VIGGIGSFLALLSACHAAFERLPVDARSLALCESDAVRTSGFLLCSNPASLATNGSMNFSGYSARLYGQPELASNVGGPLYRETFLAIGMGFPAEGVALGVAARVMNISISGYGSDNTVGLDAGASAAVNGNLSLAASVRNINLPTVGGCEERLPIDLECGLSTTPCEDLLVCLSFKMEEQVDPSLCGGVEIELSRFLFLRGGLNPHSKQFGCGLGLHAERFSLDYGVSIHDPLGLTHGISVCYTLSGR